MTPISSLIAVAVISISAATGAGVAWQWQAGRVHTAQMELKNAENNRIILALAQERELHALEQKRSAQIVAAQNDARQRESQLRADAAAAESAIDSLRSALHRAVLAARADPAICPNTAAATAELFAECGAAFSSLAATCDRHVSDLRTAVTIIEALR